MNATSPALRTTRFLTDRYDPTLQPMRWRDPSIGRFTQMDDFAGHHGNPITLNKYLYAGDNPITYSDPSGHDWSLPGLLAVSGISALVASILLPSIHGAWNQAYHVAANGTTQSLFTATFNGTATLADWKRVLSGFGSGAGAGAINALDTLSFKLISPLDDYRNQLWRSEGLDQSWIGTTANGLAWVGTGLLYTAGIVWALNAAGVPTMDVAVRTTGEFPKFLHFEYGVGGVWEQAAGEVGSMALYPGTGAGLTITGIPVIYPGAVVVGRFTADAAYNCATAVMRAVFRGWGGW